MHGLSKSFTASLILTLLGACSSGGPDQTSNQPSPPPPPPPPPGGGGSGSATLSWLPPTQNEDGSPILNLAGYNIYEGPSANTASLTLRETVNNAGLATYVVDNLSPGVHYFSITARTTQNVESDFSNIAQVTIN